MEMHSQPDGSVGRTTIDSFLTAEGVTLAAPRELWGFGGLHGGLALAAMTAAMHRATAATGEYSASASAQRLRSVTGRLHRPVRDGFRVESSIDVATRSTTAASARILAGAETSGGDGAPQSAPLASATALFGRDGAAGSDELSPKAPAVPAWHEGTLFTPPPSLVPVSEYYELRVTGTNRPYAGGNEPRLTAWVRLTEDELPPDALRVLFLVDALAPSYAAILSVPHPIPTVELTVRFSGGMAASPWVLVDALTTGVSSGGWVTETINVWGEDGTHLAEATQLRLVRPPQES